MLCLIAFGGRDHEHDIVLRDDARRWRLAMRPSQRHDLHFGGQPTRDLAQRPAEVSGCAGRSPASEAGDRRCLIFGLRIEGEVEEQDRSGHLEWIRDRIAHRGSLLPSVAMAACSVGVLVLEPANRPSACPMVRPDVFIKIRLTAPAASTPTSAMKLAFCPAGLVRPRKNCLPYCTPTA
jgi:hypothetical protein